MSDLLQTDECFVCTLSNSTWSSFSGGHKLIHGVVRCALPRDDPVKAADLEWPFSRIDGLEDKLEALRTEDSADRRFDALNSGLSRVVDLEAMESASQQKLKTGPYR